ncbi:hypothetical protein AUJ67_09105 [Candidatus Desantisbacteria bacterium CG1_02_49_89]|nr:MAG: hypothetical protein AUJ67_09105 [Candidatus Desantisbacteria bacterium CG1_02_49_89]
MKSFMESEYKLKVDPFDNKVDLSAPMAGRKKEKEAWSQIIRQRTGQRGNSFNFVIGDYGFGKSFSLYKIYEEVKKKYENVIPIFITLLPEDTIRKFGLEFIQRIFSKFEMKDFKRILSKVRKEDFDHLKSLLPEPAIIFEKVRKGNDLAFVFLRGDKVIDAKEMHALGVGRKLDSTDRAKDYLLSFLYLLKKAGLDSLLLAIDEVEYIFSQMRGSKISLAFNTLRGIHDLQSLELGETANMIFFFGISIDGWRRLTVDLQKREKSQGGPIQPFIDRKDNVITLEPLSKEETKELIKLRLKQNRTTGIVGEKPLIPFNDEFVGYVFDLTKGRPRDIVRRCDIVLLEGLEQKITLITVTFAKKVYESHGLFI